MSLEINPEDAVRQKFDEIVVGLVEAEARIMDYCFDAACVIVGQKMAPSANVHGPDSGPSPVENPVTGTIATALYTAVRQTLREGPKREKTSPVAIP